MKQYGLIGYPLTHSFSKKHFEHKFKTEHITDCVYDLFPLQQIDELPDLLHRYPNLRGLNVTIPYKEKVMPYLHEIDKIAREVGAVNCIKIADGKLIGYNTDVFGFHISLIDLLKGNKPDIAFVLGTGGAAKAVWYMLGQFDIPFIKVSSSGVDDSIGYSDIQGHWQHSHLIVNTTPLGTYPNHSTYPSIPYHAITSNDFLFDLVYNPVKSLFLQKGEEKGAAIMSGLLMLRMQAEESWEIWNG